MAAFEIKMPKLGESIEEATITKWFVKEGDTVKEDDVLLEVATDKVDSEIPSPVAGTLAKIFYKENDRVLVGTVIASIHLAGEEEVGPSVSGNESFREDTSAFLITKRSVNYGKRFYSPLVRSIAGRENISPDELDRIPGTGKDGRVRKQDILGWLSESAHAGSKVQTVLKIKEEPDAVVDDVVVEMDRVRKLIADHMVRSVQTAPHVTNILEADVTALVQWRNRMKEEFQKKENQKLTFMPVVTEAVTRALRDFPGVNISVDGYKIVYHKKINIGIAVAMPDGNLIVPVVKNADQLSLVGLALEINRLADQARKGRLLPDEIQGGTFSITNFGTFRNLMGTPIINQPQAAILAIGSIGKKPAVLETPAGDVIAIRHKVYLSLTYDHRAIDGALGGSFLRRVADYLENFDPNRTL